MEIRVAAQEITKVDSEAMVVNLFEGVEKPGGATASVDAALDGALTRLIADGEIKGKKGQVTLIHTLGKIAPARVAVLGLGKVQELTLETVRHGMGEVSRALRRTSGQRVATILHGAGAGGLTPAQAAQAIVEGSILGLYTFNKYKRDQDGSPERRELAIAEPDKAKLKEVQRGAEMGRIIAESVCLARDMVNEPANCMTPTHMAEVARRVAKEGGLEVAILDVEEMEQLGMGALLGVARGTAQPPKFIILKYQGDAEHPERVLGFVGKGVTFDTGGISLKSAEGMAAMKTDMSGGAAVIAAMRALSLLKPAVNVTGLVPASENIPSTTAQKPGDIVTALNGKSIEVENTDAEGRLLLADALAHGRKTGLSPMVDVATLTGAISTTLGTVAAGAFTNHQPTLDRLLKSAATAGEKLWQLPMYEEYKEQNRSEVADVKNTGGRSAGSITAALFLAEFAEDTPWVHLDIAGTARANSTKGHLVKGGTGGPVRTLIQFALDCADSPLWEGRES